MPVKIRSRQAVILILSVSALLFLDQLSKALVAARLSIGESIPIIRDILHITFVKNTGAAFGLFKSGTALFIVISVLVSIFIIAFILRSLTKGEFLSRKAFDFALILILSGALGNLIDRLKFGYVIDFIDVRIWPVFNFADSSITIGTMLLLVSFIAGNVNFFDR